MMDRPMTQLIAEDMMVPSEPGNEIFVRNKRPLGMSAFTPERTLLFVHGSTYPAHTGFDLPLGGQSWMEYIASHGYDVYCLDLRGYGRSTRPKEMDAPPAANPPLTRTPTAVKDIGAVLDFVLKRRNIPQLNLLGWSWGCALMAITTIQNAGKVRRLMLYAPGWLRSSPSLLAAGDGALGAYRKVTREMARTRWMTGVPERAQASLIPPGWFEQWADANFATDPVGAKENPPVLRAPNGTVQDTRDYWSSGKPMYDPGRITVPPLVAVGEWDNDTPPYMAQAIFPLLTNSPSKRLVMLAEGTHHMMLEKNRLELFKTVQSFLDDGVRP
jgi:pimeloyl-ACP methyl ester carboxylesterase